MDGQRGTPFSLFILNLRCSYHEELLEFFALPPWSPTQQDNTRKDKQTRTEQKATVIQLVLPIGFSPGRFMVSAAVKANGRFR